MYKPLLFLIALFSFQTKAQTSTYFPIPDSGIVWRQEGFVQSNSCCCTGSGPCLRKDDYQYFLSGDTLIGSFTYKKILRNGNGQEFIVGVPVCPAWCSGNYEYFTYNNVYSGSIRQDTSLRKVYYLPPDSSLDVLLYDFNLNSGDTLPILFSNPYPANYVSSIDSILIGSSYRKRFWISLNNDSNYISLIEGIGSSYGLLSPLFPNNNVSLIYNMLNCVRINGMTVYPDSTTTCSIISKIDDQKNNFSFSVFPNPFSDVIHLTLNSEELAEFFLYDIAGRNIMSKTLSGSESLNTSQLSDGIYFFKVKSKYSGSMQGKLIKK
jgi:hypothetical protein